MSQDNVLLLLNFILDSLYCDLDGLFVGCLLLRLRFFTGFVFLLGFKEGLLKD